MKMPYSLRRGLSACFSANLRKPKHSCALQPGNENGVDGEVEGGGLRWLRRSSHVVVRWTSGAAETGRARVRGGHEPGRRHGLALHPGLHPHPQRPLRLPRYLFQPIQRAARAVRPPHLRFRNKRFRAVFKGDFRKRGAASFGFRATGEKRPMPSRDPSDPSQRLH
jgi:hypothetical protein